MCCCSVKCCRIYLAVLATIVIIAGIVVCVFSAMVKNEAIFDFHDDLQKYRRIPFAISLTFGIIMLLTGLFTFFVSYKYNRIMRIILGFLSFSLFITFIVFGSLLIKEYNEGMEVLDQVCRRMDSKDYDENNDMHNLILFAGEYDMILLLSSNTFMCSEICPCKKADINLWNERSLNYIGRTKYQYNDTEYNQNYDFDPLIFRDKGGYSNFFECLEIDKAIDKKHPDESEIIPDSMLRFIKNLEDTYHCNNFCESGEFYLFRDITEGPPRSNCMKPIQSLLKRLFQSGGAISFFASFSSFFLLVGLFFNCRYKSLKDYEQWNNQNQNRENDNSAIGQFKIDESNDIGYQNKIGQKGFQKRKDVVGGRTVNIDEDGQVQVEYVLTNNQDSFRNEPDPRQSIQKLNKNYDDTKI
ncbi:tetraspanin family protein [Stylonychia lemnae]|uniref:Tetraspanin family protein n=1 Tax=Stylonychia lemnae TaxID=5949 RepID=A0A078B439_STYLE|nr:tetraspanin family protein [Stylonychia lemnae]|eukprot:CDW89300.1 tetraspanin family protein [Stylonychia lemnae]